MAKVMLVEDDNNLREIYEARLQAEGYTIVSAKDGEEALVVAKAEKPDLIISDVMMPKISGFEMLDILRNTDGLKDVKVIMLTALGQGDDQKRADRLGADRYLVKSQVTLEDIVKVTHELLQDGPEPVPSAPAPASAAPAPAPAVTPAPAVQPEPIPVAAAPVPAPAPAPAPAPQADPVTAAPAPAPAADPAPSAPAPASAAPAPAPSQDAGQQASQAADTSSAQSTSQEEASVEARIEDFVAGASTEPTPVSPPEAADAPAPETAVESVEANESDDQLLSNAVENLTVGAPEAAPVPETPVPAPAPAPQADPVTAAPAPAPAADPAPSAPAPVPETPVPAPVPEAEKPKPKADNDNVSIAHKKVITPIESDPKKDINTLLAIEEAKEAANQGPPPPTAVIATNETGEQAAQLTPTPGQQPQATEYAAAKIEAAKVSASPDAPGQQPENPADPGTIAL